MKNISIDLLFEILLQVDTFLKQLDFEILELLLDFIFVEVESEMLILCELEVVIIILLIIFLQLKYDLKDIDNILLTL